LIVISGKEIVMSTSISFPNWIETTNLAQVPTFSAEVTDTITELAQAVGLTTGRFTIVTQRGGSAIIVDPRPSDPLRPLPPARTITLLALIRAFTEIPILTQGNLILPNGGFATAEWLASQIELLTEGTKLLFNPSPAEVRVAIKRLKTALNGILERQDLIESVHGLGYRFRVWPSLITVIMYSACI
jgi:hypothetical protein